MLRISPQSAPGDPVRALRLEGRLVGPWVRELRAACESAMAITPRIRLNLAGVEYVDQNGLQLLLQLRERGVDLTECPPFTAELLRSAALAKPPGR